MVIKTTIVVGYMESVRKEYGSKNVVFSPDFLRESKALYDNVCPKAKNGVLTPIIYIFYSKNSCKTAI